MSPIPQVHPQNRSSHVCPKNVQVLEMSLSCVFCSVHRSLHCLYFRFSLSVIYLTVTGYPLPSGKRTTTSCAK